MGQERTASSATTMEKRGSMSMKLIPPDGGWGWAILFAAVVINMLVPGTIKSFGVLFAEFIRVFGATPTEASWVPALCYFLYSSLGPLSSILSTKYSYRFVTLVGGAFASFGLMLSYFANSVTFLYLSYGTMVGIGAGLCFPVTIYIVSEYFDRLRGLATGLCISGSAIGTIIISPFLRYLIDQLGHRGAVLIMGGILLNTIACGLLYHPVEDHMILVSVELEGKQHPPQTEQTKQIPEDLLQPSQSEKTVIEIEIGESVANRSIISNVDSVTLDPHYDPRMSLTRRLASKKEFSKYAMQESKEIANDSGNRRVYFDLSVLKDPLFLIILISNSTSAISNTNFMILLPVYAESVGIDIHSSALLLSIVSLFDLIGRVGGASLTDVNLMPKHYYFVSGLGISGVALALIPVGSDYAYLASLCALFGLSSGLYIGTTSIVLLDMLGPEKLASSYGISMFVNGLLQLIGPPVCNLTYEFYGSYRPIFMALGVILLLGTGLWGMLPIIRRNSDKVTQTSS